jgi:hypothetical protein
MCHAKAKMQKFDGTELDVGQVALFWQDYYQNKSGMLFPSKFILK